MTGGLLVDWNFTDETEISRKKKKTQKIITLSKIS
jgi:hypothetical protein